VDRGAAASKWVESRLTKERCLINRFRIRKLRFFLRLEGAELALPGPQEPLGLRKCAKGVRAVYIVWNRDKKLTKEIIAQLPLAKQRIEIGEDLHYRCAGCRQVARARLTRRDGHRI
jgi:hypothetical protein